MQKNGGHCSSHGKRGIGIDHLNSKSPRHFAAAGKAYRKTQRPRTHLPSYRLFSGRYLSSQGTGCDGIKAHGAARWLCSRAGRGIGIQPRAGEANGLCSWITPSTPLSCVSLQILGNTRLSVWAPCSSTDYDHASASSRSEVFCSSDSIPAFRDGYNHGTEKEREAAAQLFPCTNQWQLIIWQMFPHALWLS